MSELTKFQKFILRFFKDEIKSKIVALCDNRVLHYEVLKGLLGIYINSESGQLTIKEMKKMGIDVSDKFPGKCAVYILNFMRKKDVSNKISEFIINKFEEALK
ncbi:MAG TPA: hypothetical protein P5140_05540 [Methanofastidiosum sp.]|nr:hypothetical protein [Methanofastidiosum sp.]